MPFAFAHEIGDVPVELDLDGFRPPRMDAERVRERFGWKRPWLEVLVEHREGSDAFHREGADLLVFLDPRDQIDPSLRVREPQRIDRIVLRPL